MNSVDPDQMPHYVASDLGLHCLPMTLLSVSREEWVKDKNTAIFAKNNVRSFCKAKGTHIFFSKNSISHLFLYRPNP